MPNLLLPPNRVLTERLTTDVYPNFGGVGGADQLSSVIGALLTVVLIVAVLMLVVCAITWALANSHGNFQTLDVPAPDCGSLSAPQRWPGPG